jgi:signal transduction histidine kinase
MAWIDHDLRAIGALEPALSPAVRLSIDNARLRAGLLAQVRDLRAARRRIVAEGDDERRRLERDLHDGIQQQLLVLASELRAAGRAARRREDPTADALERSLDETTALLEEVRSVAHGIFPAILGDAGLAAALASLADVAALPVELVCEPELRYPPPVEATAYRVVAEAIENAVQHSGATLVTAEVDEDSEVLVVRVHDDGRGGAAAEHVGGLAELVDRVGAIDGTLSIASGAGSGTTVAAVIPCVW